MRSHRRRPLHDHLGRHPRRRQPRARTASTSTRSTATSSTPGAASTRTRSRTSTATTAVRNWDDDRRIADQEADGVVGEVIFPNTVPPFFPSGVPVRPARRQPEEYEHRLAGIQAHNRWMVDFVRRAARAAGRHRPDLPQRRRRRDRRRHAGSRSTACAAASLLPDVAPDVTWVKPLYDPSLRPALGGVRGARASPVNLHSGTGSPDYGRSPSAPHDHGSPRSSFYSQRPFVHLLLGGVFERFPRLKFVITEQGCVVGRRRPLTQLDGDPSPSVRKTGRIGELKYTAEDVLPWPATRVLPPQRVGGRQLPQPRATSDARHAIGRRPVHVGQRLPARRGHGPYTREHCARSFAETDPVELQQVLAGNAAEALRLRPRRAGPARRAVRPDRRRDRRPPRPDPRRRHQPRLPPPMTPTQRRGGR